MKEYTIPLDQRQVDLFFSPIRDKVDIINTLMKTIKLLLVQKASDVPNPKGEVKLVVSNMSRIFFFSENKYFSINFPFSFRPPCADLGLLFYSKNIEEIDNKTTSDVITLLADTDRFSENSVLDFIEPISDLEPDEENIWPFFLELFMYEDGYIRYDYDEKHVNGALHPLNHYDVFHTSKATFKIGLTDRLEKKQFIDLVDTKTDCHFVTKETKSKKGKWGRKLFLNKG